MSYEDAVHWMRAQPEHQEGVRLSYLDADNQAAAVRFAASEEFAEVAKWGQLRIGTTKKILDVGCGNGIASYAMATLGHHVTALDPDMSADVGLEATRRLAPLVAGKGGLIECIQGGVESVDFPDNTFDVVYTRQAVHHFADLEGGLRECARVLKPAGVFIATREHVVDDDGQLQQFFSAHPLHHKTGSEYAYSLERYVSAMEKAGFSQVQAFARWDTVVNHFPESNTNVRKIIINGLNRRLRLPVGGLAMRIPGFENRMRRQLNDMDNMPGRLYSFIARIN